MFRRDEFSTFRCQLQARNSEIRFFVEKLGDFWILIARMASINPSIPFSFPGIAEDIDRLKRLLGHALSLIKWAAPLEPQLLNIACGRADETGILLETLAAHRPRCHYLGLDLRQPEIQEARRRWGRAHEQSLSSAANQDRQIEFRVADAASASALPEGAVFDCIFIRHQNYWDAPAVWDLIFHHARARLKPQGLLIFTSYFDREHELAIAAHRSRGFPMLLDIPNAQSRALADAPGKSVDRRVAIFSHDFLTEGISEPINFPSAFRY
jgi:SAM-dependent methyltransferase